MTTTTKTKLSALALAMASFTMLAAGGSASANVVRPVLGHGPVVTSGGLTGAGGARQGTIVGEQPGSSGVRQIPFQPISQPHQPLPLPVGPFKPLPINPPSTPPPSQS